VFERILGRIREKVRLREYVVTHHARKEMREDGFTIYDIERGIFSGDILERQKDRQTGKWKYRVRGETFDDRAVEIMVKLSPTGRLVIITVYAP
jgi:nucleoside-triphosphatase THEP1